MAVFSPMEGGEGGGEKIKGRPMAAEEKPGEADILFSQLSGNAEGQRISPRRHLEFSLFVRHTNYPSSALSLSRRLVANYDLRCNLKTSNMMRPVMILENARPKALRWATASFVII
jgi:hypothetical protein